MIFRFLNYFILIFQKILNYTVLIYYKHFNKKNIYSKININSNEKILILVPHADDEIIGCYTILSNYSKQVKLFYLNYTGENQNKHIKEIRLQELNNLSNLFNINLISIEADYVNNLRNIINFYNPSIIFVPTLIDWHPEHFRTNEILFNTLNNIKRNNIRVISYSISVPIPPSYFTSYYPLSIEEQNKKWNIFKQIYRSQLSIPLYRFKINEKINGNFCYNNSAEVFYEYKDYQTFLNVMSLILKDKIILLKIKKLKKYINNIWLLRKKSQHIYSLVIPNKSEI